MDIITSVHRHDFVRCECGKVAVDGGTHYLRRLWSLDATPEDAYTELSIEEAEEDTPE
jgi:hypothetical protein